MASNKTLNLVLIHGWAIGSGVWKKFIPYLNAYQQVITVDLPGYNQPIKQQTNTDTPQNIEQITQKISPKIPKNSILVGWSLGGLIATKLASIRQDISALALLASSPCFINKTDWKNSIDPIDYAQLSHALIKDKTKTLQRFIGLVATGDTNPRQTIQNLKQHIKDNMPDTQTLQIGLDILQNEDQRELLKNSHCPVAIILGQHDTLIKHTTKKAIHKIQPKIEIMTIANAGHAPFLSQPQQTAITLNDLSKYFEARL